MTNRELFTCPCCGYKTLTNESEYEICPICFWQDDGNQLVCANSDGGANFEVSLKQAQRNFEEFGACTKDMVKHVRKPTQGDVKDPEWRPINDTDVFPDSFSPDEERRLIESKDWSILDDTFYWRSNYWLRDDRKEP